MYFDIISGSKLFLFKLVLINQNLNIKTKKLFAEFFGTYWLIIGGCGNAHFASNYYSAGIGFVGVSIAFELTV